MIHFLCRSTIALIGEQEGTKHGHQAPEQIVRKLREVDQLLGEGTPLVQVREHLEVTVATYYRWRNHYEGAKADKATRLKDLENENARLKRLVAEQALAIDMPKEVSRANF